MPLKILLIEPYNKNFVRIFGKVYMAKLTLPYIASYIPEDIPVEFIDENTTPIDFNTDADCVFLTALSVSGIRAYEIADKFRQKGKKVVIGGVHASMLPEEAAAHADVGVNPEPGRLRHGPPGLGVGAAHNPDALRRAGLGADAARGTADVLFAALAFFVEQEGFVAELFRHRQFFFGVLDGKRTLGVLAGTMGDAFRRVIALAPPADVVEIGVNEALQGDAQSFENAFSVHGFFSVLVGG